MCLLYSFLSLTHCRRVTRVAIGTRAKVRAYRSMPMPLRVHSIPQLYGQSMRADCLHAICEPHRHVRRAVHSKANSWRSSRAMPKRLSLARLFCSLHNTYTHSSVYHSIYVHCTGQALPDHLHSFTFSRSHSTTLIQRIRSLQLFSKLHTSPRNLSARVSTTAQHTHTHHPTPICVHQPHSPSCPLCSLFTRHPPFMPSTRPTLFANSRIKTSLKFTSSKAPHRPTSACLQRL